MKCERCHAYILVNYETHERECFYADKNSSNGCNRSYKKINEEMEEYIKQEMEIGNQMYLDHMKENKQ